MKSNRSIPNATVIPVLTYPDVPKAAAWLCGTFGLEERLVIGEGHRIQLAIGDGAVVIRDTFGDHNPPKVEDASSHEVMVRVENVTTHYEHACTKGAHILTEPTDFPFGERQYEAEDLAGHRWVFTETIQDVDPAEWGGITRP